MNDILSIVSLILSLYTMIITVFMLSIQKKYKVRIEEVENYSMFKTELNVVSLGDRDVLIVKVDPKLPQELYAKIHDAVCKQLKDTKNRFIVMPNMIQFEILRGKDKE